MIKTLLLLLLIFTIKTSLAEVSSEAQAHFLKAFQVIEKAKSPRDYLTAELEFEKAVELSPEWAEAYYNLALVSEVIGKEAKAIKNYKKYMELIFDEEEKQKVLKKIEGLRKLRNLEKSMGIYGLNLAGLKDGIYVLKIVNGSRLEQAGLRAGDKILTVDGKPVRNLREFYEVVEESLTYKSRYTPVAIEVLRGGKQFKVACPLRAFRTNVYEIEEDELEEEVYKADKPVAVVAWAKWCSICWKFIPVLEEISEKYKRQVKFVTINVEMSEKFIAKYNMRAVPTTFLFKGEQLVDKSIGFKGTEAYERWLNEALMKEPSSKASPLNNSSGGTDSRSCGEKKVVISLVVKGSVADKAGLKEGDQILFVDGKRVSHVNRFLLTILGTPGNHTVEVKRNSQVLTITLEKQEGKPLGFGFRNLCE